LAEVHIQDGETLESALRRFKRFERVCRNEQLTYLTPIQVSVKLGITKDTLVRWRKNGRGPLFVKQGGRIVYPSRELESWLQSRRRVQAALEVWGSG
jgi:predicted DNA-binding transcriptional regulator AlpA